MIEYIDVCKRYGEKTILSHFDITIDCGTFLAIIGTSGSGKTTILKMINGLVKPDCGKIMINGKDIQEEDLIQLRRNIGYSIQGNILFPHLTVFENIAYVLRLQKRSEEEIEKIVEEKLKMIKLPLEIKDRYPNQLSGGQQQRVGIARALASSPDILLMDEPFGAVDAITRHELQRELKTLHKETGLTVVFITHDITEALKLGTKILVMDSGAVQQFGTPDEIKNHPANEFVKTLVDMANICD